METIEELTKVWEGDDGHFLGDQVSPQWEKGRRSYMKRLNAVVGDIRYTEFGPEHHWRIQNYVTRELGLSNSYANKITHDLLPAMFRDLENARKVPIGTRDRIMHGVKRLREEGERDLISLTLLQRNVVLEAFRDHWAQPLVSFLFFSGVRIGEAAGIRQRDVDWSRKTIRIQRSRHRKSVTAGKTRRSQRVLRLPRAAIAAIASLQREGERDGYVFRNERGSPLTQDAFREDVWHPILKRIGLAGFLPHGTRHTFATLSLEAGIPAAKVAAYLGITTERLEKTYSHVVALDDWDRAVSAPSQIRAAK